MIRNFASITAAIALAGFFSIMLAASDAHAVAGKKVDCDAVMAAYQAGKKPKDIAQEMNISRGSVYRCHKKASMAAAAPVASPTASPAAHAAAPKHAK